METTAHSPWDTDYKGTEPAPVYGPLWHMLQQFLRGFPATSVLDFGCGDGNYAYLMAEEGLRVTGVDISLRAIEKAVTHGGGLIDSRCEFIRHDSIPEDWPDNAFDVVVMLNVLHPDISRVECTHIQGIRAADVVVYLKALITQKMGALGSPEG